MDHSTFISEAYKLIDWIANYHKEIRSYPVLPNVKPNQIIDQLALVPPQKGETIESIFNDFKNIIMPGITHWQSPYFMAYFPSNMSYPSLLAEFLSAGIGIQCMSWIASPAATELEQQMIKWLNHLLLPDSVFDGVIHDTASTSTLCALLAARQNFIHQHGFQKFSKARIYCSSDAHYSVEKAGFIIGLQPEQIIKIETNSRFELQHNSLRKIIKEHSSAGYIPMATIATLGTTSCTAMDPIKEITDIITDYPMWLHVDAAYAGAALALPSFRAKHQAIKYADSWVVNPHKWLFIHFDCSVLFVKDAQKYEQVFELTPHYLSTPNQDITRDYRNWGIALGRRFRALKLWFVLRYYGVEGICHLLTSHIKLSQHCVRWIAHSPNFEQMAPITLNLICFRFHPPKIKDIQILNRLNQQLLTKINQSKRAFLSPTKLNGNYTIRWVIGNINVTMDDITKIWKLINETAKQLSY